MEVTFDPDGHVLSFNSPTWFLSIDCGGSNEETGYVSTKHYLLVKSVWSAMNKKREIKKYLHINNGGYEIHFSLSDTKFQIEHSHCLETSRLVFFYKTQDVLNAMIKQFKRVLGQMNSLRRRPQSISQDVEKNSKAKHISQEVEEDVQKDQDVPDKLHSFPSCK